MVKPGRGDLHLFERLIAGRDRNSGVRQDGLKLLRNGEPGEQMPSRATAGENDMKRFVSHNSHQRVSSASLVVFVKCVPSLDAMRFKKVRPSLARPRQVARGQSVRRIWRMIARVDFERRQTDDCTQY